MLKSLVALRPYKNKPRAKKSGLWSLNAQIQILTSYLIYLLLLQYQYKINEST